MAKALGLREIESELANRFRVKSGSSDIVILPGFEGYVSELFIGAKHRGQGMGNSLLEENRAAGRVERRVPAFAFESEGQGVLQAGLLCQAELGGAGGSGEYD